MILLFQSSVSHRSFLRCWAALLGCAAGLRSLVLRYLGAKWCAVVWCTAVSALILPTPRAAHTVPPARPGCTDALLLLTVIDVLLFVNAHYHGTASCAGPDLTRYRGCRGRSADRDGQPYWPGRPGPKRKRCSPNGWPTRSSPRSWRPAPRAAPAALNRLLREVRHYQPQARNCAADLTAHIRIHLFALIDVMWWGSARAFVTDSDLLHSAELADLEPLRSRGELHFRYRRQARTLPRGRRARPSARRGPAARRGPRACGSPGPGRRWSRCSTRSPPSSPAGRRPAPRRCG